MRETTKNEYSTKKEFLKKKRLSLVVILATLATIASLAALQLPNEPSWNTSPDRQRHLVASNVEATMTAWGPSRYETEISDIPRNIRESTLQLKWYDAPETVKGGSGILLNFKPAQENTPGYIVVLTNQHLAKDFESKVDRKHHLLISGYTREQIYGDKIIQCTQYDQIKEATRRPQQDLALCAIKLFGTRPSLGTYMHPIKIDTLQPISASTLSRAHILVYGYPTPSDLTTGGDIATRPFLSTLTNLQAGPDQIGSNDTAMPTKGSLSLTGLSAPGMSGGAAFTGDRVFGLETGGKYIDKYNYQSIITPIPQDFQETYQLFLRQIGYYD